MSDSTEAPAPEPTKPAQAPEIKRFQLKRKTIPLELEDEKGMIKRYDIVELDGTARDLHMNDMSSRMTNLPNGERAITNFTNMHANFLALCLFERKDNKYHPLETAFLQGLPSDLQEELWKMGQELSGLSKKADEEAKNS